MSKAASTAMSRRQHGVVLVVVLWLLALMTLMAASYSMTTRTETALTARLVRGAQARALAEAGVWFAAQQIARQAGPDRWPAAGEFHVLAFDGGTVTIQAQDEAGKVDLNSANVELLHHLLQDASQDRGAALTALQSILDWRDRDGVRRPGGAERADYVESGAEYGPRNGPFIDHDELRLVHGIDETLYRRLAPAVTVYSGQRGVNPDVAVREALLALPGMTPADADALIASRGDASVAGALPDINAQFVSRPKQRVVTIRSTGQAADVHMSVEAVVRVPGGGRSPYALLSWRDGNAQSTDTITDGSP